MLTEQEQLEFDIDLRLVDLWGQWDEAASASCLTLTEEQECILAAAFRVAYWQGNMDGKDSTKDDWWDGYDKGVKDASE